MPYDGKLLARARDALDQRRAANQAEQQRRLSLVYARVPEIQQIDLRMRAQMAELVKLTLSRRPDLTERIEELKKENLDLQVRRAELLTEQGYGMDYLDEICSCPKCRDTGILNGEPCECLHKLYNRELTKELGVLLQSGDESFERFELTLYNGLRRLQKVCGQLPQGLREPAAAGGHGSGQDLSLRLHRPGGGGKGLFRLLRQRHRRAGGL